MSRVRELALVAVARAVGEADEIAGLHGLAVQLGVLLDAAAEALGRGVEAQRFLDGVRKQGRVRRRTARRASA